MTEHGDEGVQHDAGLGQVHGRHLEQDVLGVQGDLGVLSIDDGRQGQDHVIGVVDDRIDWTILDDWEIGFEMRVSRVKIHQLCGSKLFGLIQGHKFDIFRGLCHVPKWTLDGVQIMGSNRGKGSLSC